MMKNTIVPRPNPTVMRPGTRARRPGAALVLAAALACGAAGCQNSGDVPKTDPDKDPFSGLVGCKGMAISSDGTLDVDLKTLRLSGKVTLNGAALPDSGGERGMIELVEKHTGTRSQLKLGTQGVGCRRGTEFR